MLENKYSKKVKIIKISFKLKSFHNYNFKFILPKILKKAKGLGLSTKGFVSLPTKIQRFTVLRSPHVDKKSREQFEIKTYIKVLNITCNFNSLFEKQKIKLLINFIKNSASGLSLKITYTV